MKIESYRLNSMPSAKCHVDFYIDGCYLKEVRLVSYTTTILSVKFHGNDADVEVMYPVNCSRTTARHVNRFTTELFGTNEYHALKKLVEGGTLRFDGMAVRISDLFQNYRYYGKRLSLY
jgi:hypothetical protein